MFTYLAAGTTSSTQINNARKKKKERQRRMKRNDVELSKSMGENREEKKGKKEREWEGIEKAT